MSELYYPEDTSTGYFMTGIAEGLAQYRDVRVLCSQPTYASRGKYAQKEERRNGVVVRRCYGTRFNKDVLVLRMVNAITLACSMFFNAVKAFERRDQVIVVTNPPVMPFVVMAACRIRNARYHLLIHDVYPDVLVVCGLIRKDLCLIKLFERVNGLLYRHAEHIITLGRDMRDRVERISDLALSKIVIITNWGDTDTIHPANGGPNPLLVRLGLEEAFVIQYSGNMGRTHGLEDVLEAAKLVRDEEDMHFLFIGWGAKRRWLETAVRDEGLQRITILDNQPRVELSVSLCACDVAVIALVSGMSGISVPSRLYNVLASGRPIIAVCDADSELARVVTENRIGWVVAPGRPELLAEVLKEAKRTRSLLTEMGHRARLTAERQYTIQHVIEQYCEVLDNHSHTEQDA